MSLAHDDLCSQAFDKHIIASENGLINVQFLNVWAHLPIRLLWSAMRRSMVYTEMAKAGLELVPLFDVPNLTRDPSLKRRESPVLRLPFPWNWIPPIAQAPGHPRAPRLRSLAMIIRYNILPISSQIYSPVFHYPETTNAMAQFLTTVLYRRPQAPTRVIRTCNAFMRAENLHIPPHRSATTEIWRFLHSRPLL